MSFEVLRDWFAQCDDSIAPREVTREVFDAASRDGKIITRKFGNSKFICLIPPDPTWDDLHAITQTLHRHRFTPEKLTAETWEIQERYLFLRKVATYLTRLDTAHLDDDEKRILTSIQEFFTELWHIGKSENSQDAALSDEDIEKIESYLVGEKAYIWLKKVSWWVPLPDAVKQRKTKQILRILAHVEKEKQKHDANTRSHMTHSLFREGLHAAKLPSSEFVRGIHEVGVMRLLEQARKKWWGVFNRKLQKHITRIIQNTDDHNKVDIVREIVSLVRQNFTHAENNGGSPSTTLSSQMTQCIWFTTLGRYLEKIPGIQYWPISMKEHMAALVLIDDQLFFVDVTNENIIALVSSDFEKSGITAAELEDYIRGQKTFWKSFILPEKISRRYQYIDPESLICMTASISDKRLSTAGWLLSNLSASHKKRNDDPKSEELCLLSIEAGNKIAHFNLGVLYQYSENPEICDHKKAEEQYLLSIEAGHKIAHFNLGVLYQYSENPEICDHKKAEEQYLLSIEAGKKKAHNDLGNLYVYSENPEICDHKKAEEQYLLSIEAGYKIAHFNLGVLYQYSEHIKNLAKAREHFQKFIKICATYPGMQKFVQIARDQINKTPK
jgi:TPR repeat protein